MAKICGLMLLVLVGCSAAVESTPEKPVDVQAFIAGVDVQARAITAKQDQAIASIEATRTEIVSQNKQIIDTLKTLEASLSAPKPNGQEVIKSALESPEKANTQQAPLKVATPGTSQESLVELASRLYARGVNVHNKTREELEAIDAQLVGTKATPVQYKTRPTYSQPAGTVCVNGRCFVPQVSSRRKR